MKGVYGQSKMAFHEEKLKSLARGEIAAPIYARVKPTNKCNHKCFYCSYDPEFKYLLSEGKDARDEIPRSKMDELLNDFGEIGVKAITYSGGGEPLVYPHISEAMRKTLEKGMELSIITNGQKLDGERAEILAESEWVRVSADYSKPETFKDIRRVSEGLFSKLEKNIRDFAKRKKEDCELGISFIVTHQNAAEVLDSAKFFKDLGANHIRFSPVFIPHGHTLSKGGSEEYHAPFKDNVLRQIEEARKLEGPNFKVFDYYQTDFDSVMVAKRPYPRCFMMETVPVVAANQKVYFCHDKAYSEGGLLGSIEDISFKDLWFSEEAKKIFASFNPRDSCQHHCTGDGRNIAIGEMIKNLDKLEKFKPESEKHKNFI